MKTIKFVLSLMVATLFSITVGATVGLTGGVEACRNRYSGFDRQKPKRAGLNSVSVITLSQRRFRICL